MAVNNNPKITRLGKIVLNEIVQKNGPVKQQDIMSSLGITLRSVRYALKLLQDAELVEKQPDLQDLRSSYYIPTQTAQAVVA